MRESNSPSDESAIKTGVTEEQVTTSRGRLAQLGRRGIAFYAALTVFSLFIVGLVGEGLMALFTFWFAVPAQFGGLQFVEAHRIHFITRSAFGWTIIIALVALFWRPKRSIGAVYQLSVFISTLVAVVIISSPGLLAPSDWASLGLILLLTAAVIALHPARNQIRDGLRLERLSRPLLVLAVLAAIPLLRYAANQLALQRIAVPPGASDQFAEHVLDFHFGDMVAASLLILALAFVASLRPLGWLLPAVTAGILAIVIGLASVVFPGVMSGVGITWGAIAIVWGLAFIGVSLAERFPGARWLPGRSKAEPTVKQVQR